MHRQVKLSSQVFMACCCSILFASQVALAASDGKPDSKSSSIPKEVASGRPMTATELRRIYSGKTWMWENGGGYMDPSGRFDAVSGANRTRATLANGKWSTSGKGRMCFQGIWKMAARKNRAETCFTHYVSGDAIYQRREPDGTWYAFRRSPVNEADEFNKVVEGNRIAAQLRPQQGLQASNRRNQK